MKKEIVEINGIKFEVDLSNAKVVSEYRIGDKVNVLMKEGYDDRKVVKPGIIVDFDNFKELPTMTIAYMNITYDKCEIKFIYFNNSVSDFDIAPCRETDILFNKGDVIEKMDREMAKKEEELADLKRKKSFFLLNFNKHFELEEAETNDAT